MGTSVRRLRIIGYLEGEQGDLAPVIVHIVSTGESGTVAVGRPGEDSVLVVWPGGDGVTPMVEFIAALDDLARVEAG